MIKHIPNSITALNLALGFLSIVSTSLEQYENAIYLILGAALADLLDGALARLLNAFSELGKELDSLADLVSFGVAPSFLAFSLLIQIDAPIWLPHIAILFTLSASLRLARFNITPSNHSAFTGLPTPAGALTLLGYIWYGLLNETMIFGIKMNPTLLLPPVLILVALLMISKIKMFSLKTKTLHWKTNEPRYIILIIGLVALIFIPFAALAITMTCYIFYSVVVHLLPGKNLK
jgi:CDP-diacylglycerol--serine O-phosphatidyltransferase